jgi:multiple sugar transport system permease protein/raffinose/stachyose/melibiose transport system permease protein
MTGGGPAHYTEVIAIYMYQNTFRYYKYGYGSAVSIIIILMSLGFIQILQVVFNKLEKKFD